MTVDDLKDLIRLEAKALLREELTLEVSTPHFMNDNILTIALNISGEEIAVVNINKWDLPQ